MSIMKWIIFTNNTNFFHKHRKYFNKKGQGVVEYAVLLAFIVGLAVFLNGGGIGNGVEALFEHRLYPQGLRPRRGPTGVPGQRRDQDEPGPPEPALHDALVGYPEGLGALNRLIAVRAKVHFFTGRQKCPGNQCCQSRPARRLG